MRFKASSRLIKFIESKALAMSNEAIQISSFKFLADSISD
jgi:hypothetical protein